MKRARGARVSEDQLWFYHPEMQVWIAHAERNLAEGRSTTTKTLEETRAFLDRLKGRPASGSGRC